jgi:hypothetical protein
MTSHARFFKVWCHRYAASIFGAGSSPVIRNGAFLCFDSEQRAQAECDRLNAQRNDMQVRYSVEPSHVEVAVPLQAASRAQAQAPSFLAPAMAPSYGFGHQMHAVHAAGRDGQKIDANP